jgi:hypothetical protein
MTPPSNPHRARLEAFVEEAYRRGSVPDAAGDPIELAAHSVEADAALRDRAGRADD